MRRVAKNLIELFKPKTIKSLSTRLRKLKDHSLEKIDEITHNIEVTNKYKNSFKQIRIIITSSFHSPEEYYEYLKPIINKQIKMHLKLYLNLKCKLVMKAVFEKVTKDNEKEIISFYTHGDIKIIHDSDEIKQFTSDQFSHINEKMKISDRINSNHKFLGFEFCDIYLYKVDLMRAKQYFTLPFKHRNILNIQNKDDKCFLYCILAKLHYGEIKSHRDRVSNYKRFEHEINMGEIPYPFKIKDLEKFHKQNPNIAVNIFCLQNQSDLKSIVPLKIFKQPREKVIDILYVTNGSNEFHYVLITDLEAIYTEHKHKVYICRNCCMYKGYSKEALDNHRVKCSEENLSEEIVTSENNQQIFVCRNCENKSYKTETALRNHQLDCFNNKPAKITLPNKFKNTLKFEKYYMESEIPFRIYADFETINNMTQDQNSFEQKPSCFSIVLISDFPDIFPNQYITRLGKSSDETIAMFIEEIKNLQEQLYKKLRITKSMRKLNEEQIKIHEESKHCDWCKKEFSNKYLCKSCFDEVKENDICTLHTQKAEKNCDKCKTKKTCHAKKYPIELDNNEVPKKKCNLCHEIKDDNACHNFKVYQPHGKVKHHNHYSGEFKNTLCSSCNLKEGNKTKFVPIYFHNLNYDSHLFIKELISNLNIEGKIENVKSLIECIDNHDFTIHPENDDISIIKDKTRFAQLSQDELAYEKSELIHEKERLEKEIKNSLKFKILSRTTEDYISIDYGCLRFLDSNKFFQAKLEEVAESLKNKEDFVYTIKYMKNNQEKIDLITQKGVYPYDYMDSFERYSETQLPPQNKFYSRLKQSDISEEDYERAKKVWNVFECKNLGDYTKLYCMSDTLILADCFENFRKFFLGQHNIDPCHSYSLPGLTWEVGLKYTGINLELITDYDMLLMFEKGKRGGISTGLGQRKVTANNKYLPSYNPDKPSNYILYIDANNLYGWAMSQPLPTSDFKWQYNEKYNYKSEYTRDYCSDYQRLLDDEIPFLIECDIEYPMDVKLKTYKFPLMPVNRKVEFNELSDFQKDILLSRLKANFETRDCTLDDLKRNYKSEKKLILDLHNKERYVVHHRLLRFYLEQGLKVTKVHKILTFKESPWLKTYIDFNNDQRIKATKQKNDFEKDLWKLMNNSFYGKTIENIRNRISFDLFNNEKAIRKEINKPEFKNLIKFSDNCVGIQKKILNLNLNKPIYLGCSILDLSKEFMYRQYYQFFNEIWPNNELIGMDTDSFFMNIKTDDVYKDMKKNITHFDTSEYPDDSELFSKDNEKVIGKWKDELKGKVITDMIFLKSKVYAFKTKDKEVKKLKGCSKTTQDKNLCFNEYDKILNSSEEIFKKQYQIHSKKHEIYFEEINKKVLCSFDDKRYLVDSVNTLPHFRKSLLSKN